MCATHCVATVFYEWNKEHLSTIHYEKENSSLPYCNRGLKRHINSYLSISGFGVKSGKWLLYTNESKKGVHVLLKLYDIS